MGKDWAISHRIIHRVQKAQKFYEKRDYKSLVYYIIGCLPFIVLMESILRVVVDPWEMKREAGYLVLSQIFGKFLNRALKRVFAQPRPFAGAENTQGMPSYHAQSAFFLSVVLCKGRVKSLLGFILFSLAGIIAYTRILLKKHTYMQILVGGMVGTSCGFTYLWLNQLLASVRFFS